MTFDEFVANRNVRLLDWQKEAADALLNVMHNHRGAAAGKSLLMRELDVFISEHGNTFEV